MKIFTVILLVLFLYSCGLNDEKAVLKEIEKYADTSKSFQLLGSNETIRSDSPIALAYLQLYESTKNIFTIETKVFGELYGHNFFFRQNGELSDYLFYCRDEGHYTYRVKYDYTNKIFTETGTPYLDYMKYDSLENKKIFFNFSAFPRSNLDISVSKDSIHFEKVKLKKSTFMPLVEVYEYNTTKQDSVVYFKIMASKPIVELKNLPSTITEIRKVKF